MELFAGVADMLGEGLPLTYLFITTDANAAPHTKQRVLIAWMEALSSLGIVPRFTLSDKDQSEINALRQVWPEAKHQLCLWHVLRALKRRLSQNENPGPYNALEAHRAFHDIDPAFVPLGQMSAGKVRTGGLLSQAHSDCTGYHCTSSGEATCSNTSVCQWEGSRLHPEHQAHLEGTPSHQ
jgi:hypothetical protein